MKIKTSIYLASFYLLAAPVSATERPAADHAQTRELIAFVERAAGLFEREGQGACDTFKNPEGRYRHGDEYVFVLGFDGKARCHAASPELEGRDLFALHDADGKPIMELMLRQLEGGSSEGWVHYLWPRPADSVQTWKSTYLRRARSPDDGEDYIVAAGAYNLPMEKLFVVDRVEEAARLLTARGEAAFETLRSRSGGFIFLDAYVFVMSLEGKMLVHPFSPELEGRDVLGVHDPDGIYPGREMLELVESAAAGWVEYSWPRPERTEPVFKETYVRKVTMGERGVLIGAGVYFE